MELLQTVAANDDNSGLGRSRFTFKQLTHRLEKHFPVHLPGEGSLAAGNQVSGDRFQSSFEDTYLDILGPTDAVKGLLYSFRPGLKSESSKKRAWAGILMRNALPGWRGGKAWARRSLFQLEANPGKEVFEKEVEGYSIIIAYEPGIDAPDRRIVMRIMPVLVESGVPRNPAAQDPLSEGSTADKPATASLGLSMSQLLGGLGNAFPERLEQRGELYLGPDIPYDQFFSENNFASLSTAGVSKDLIQIQYSYQLREDHKPEWERNRAYALALIRNVFPDWSGAGEWLRGAIAKTEDERGEERLRLVRDGIAVEVIYYLENIGISILPEERYF
ncbi:hypothetical protein [Denitrobaculum tricleocarpae]|nr:hypothetical protein [Denitrobaculum tricleocarpae]